MQTFRRSTLMGSSARVIFSDISFSFSVWSQRRGVRFRGIGEVVPGKGHAHRRGLVERLLCGYLARQRFPGVQGVLQRLALGRANLARWALHPVLAHGLYVERLPPALGAWCHLSGETGFALDQD